MKIRCLLKMSSGNALRSTLEGKVSWKILPSEMYKLRIDP